MLDMSTKNNNGYTSVASAATTASTALVATTRHNCDYHPKTSTTYKKLKCGCREVKTKVRCARACLKNKICTKRMFFVPFL